MNVASWQGEFRIAGKAFFLTYPQCEASKEDLAAFLKGKGRTNSVVVAKEAHETEGNHLHAYVNYERRHDIKKTDYFDFQGHHGNYQTCKNYLAVIKYIKKDGDYLEEGIDTKQYEAARESKKSTIGAKLIKREQTVEQAVEEHPELIFIYGQLKKNVETFLLNTTKLENFERVNYWIRGDPGIGKSYWARNTFPDAFIKQPNKWWDGYKGQAVVILEDIDTPHLGHYLKLWGDNYGVTGETKGGTIPLPYKQFIITSNYEISEIWKEDKQFIKAIERRFKQYTIIGDRETGYRLAEPITYNYDQRFYENGIQPAEILIYGN